MKILILGVNGFIGNRLAEHILTTTPWEVFGMDLGSDKVAHLLQHRQFHFVEGDISINREWVEYHVKKCDVVLPLVAIATPIAYVREPLRVFELDFEENLRVIRDCVKYKKRVIFPSTSEVYGMCPDESFAEDTSHLVLGPIQKQRWIYSCSKQLLDRVIWAYGQEEHLSFTLVRPFNWIGPKLDALAAPKEGSSRVVTQFIHNLVTGQPIKLVNGGQQRRSFTYLDDGIDCLMKIIEDRDKVCNGQIFNIGNPHNDMTITELAHTLRTLYHRHPLYRGDGVGPEIVHVTEEAYYGQGYQDMAFRKPSIQKAKELLGWEPRVHLNTALALTLDAYLKEHRNRSMEKQEIVWGKGGQKRSERATPPFPQTPKDFTIQPSS